jgi:hypothetical protein
MANTIDKELSAMDELSINGSDDKSAMSSEWAPGHETSSAGSTNDEQELKNSVIKQEEKHVRRARILVGVAFLACSVAVSTAVYFFTERSDERTFETEVSRIILSTKSEIIY